MTLKFAFRFDVDLTLAKGLPIIVSTTLRECCRQKAAAHSPGRMKVEIKQQIFRGSAQETWKLARKSEKERFLSWRSASRSEEEAANGQTARKVEIQGVQP